MIYLILNGLSKNLISPLKKSKIKIPLIPRQTVTLIQITDNYEEILNWFKALKLDKTNENKKAIRAMTQETQNNSMDELLSKRQAKEMRL